MNKFRIEAGILALGVVLLGAFIKSGLSDLAVKDRVVSVKGLAEMEVPANVVTWPLVFKLTGDDLPALYEQMSEANRTIISFLKKNGITDKEIAIGAPNVQDQNTDAYRSGPVLSRYIMTSVITVTSEQVNKIREMISQQGELLKRGIPINGSNYEYPITYNYTQLNSVKPKMIEEATKNARTTAEKFAKDSDSKLGKIKNASQGQFSIEDRDNATPYIKKIRVVTSVDYFLKD